MSKHNLILIQGALVAILPFLGLPFSFKKWGALVLGLGIIIIGIWVKRESALKEAYSDEEMYSDSRKYGTLSFDEQYQEDEQEPSEETEE